MKFKNVMDFALEASKQPLYDKYGNKHEMIFRESTMSICLYINGKKSDSPKVLLSEEYTTKAPIPHLSVVYFELKDNMGMFGIGFYNSHNDTVVTCCNQSILNYNIKCLSKVKQVNDSDLGAIKDILYFRPSVKKAISDMDYLDRHIGQE